MDVLLSVLNIALVVFAVALIVIVLLQKSKSSGLGSAFGGDTTSFTGARGKAAGREMKLQKITVWLSIIMGVLALAIMILNQFNSNDAVDVTKSMINFLRLF